MNTLVQEWLARPASETTGLHSGDDPSDLRFRTWAEVRTAGRKAAAGLAAAGIAHGDAVAILAGDPGDVADLVQAIWLRGASFTMLHQPTPRSDLAVWLEETREVIAMLGAKALIVGDPFAEPLAGMDVGTKVVTVAELDGHDEVPAVDIAADDVAILQLTSGSTGTPKAVAITFDNVENNQKAMLASVEPSGTDVAVSWLPLYHDMGMIGLMVMPMLEDAVAVITTPLAFLKKPQSWAELITRFGGTCTAAPNFAYAVLAKRLRRAPDGAYDLSSLRVAINGAEPIDETSLELFISEGARFGLRPEAIMPSYGMAETTLAVSFDTQHQRYAIDTLDAHAAESEGEVRRVDESTRTHVRLGHPVPGIELKVVDDEGVQLPADRIGTMLVRGRAVTARYLKPGGFVSAIDENGWLDTGDLGYVTESGEVVVAGRKKDVIIVSGRNISPTVIERAACSVAGVRPGNAAAVAYRRLDGREGIAVVAESELADDKAEAERIHDEVARAVFDAVGVSVSVVTLIGKGELPKTPSGKIRRHSAADLVVAN
ncbi:putative fatty-acid--CoA ligase [Gordonia araii NBRC 100433]|uniref:Putative fatty-acid--CoA ligase n=1 Tax=Gordonia araii NBRC 100433 TaxID=1073574 RepID=G7GX73_9ACTN|nr:long-chain-fatty-acid--CoA ligase [Gordonia araii]NNG98171.1 AMP-binding protein [Gordonia araii NBRC 100433]GAB08198.1 putative fatty-acid--CoA ligase [Gordonia araii NBRC 100433]